jgi:peptidoglycan/xylan/chitin deacetylase (PgdA/CDA1 family)
VQRRRFLLTVAAATVAAGCGAPRPTPEPAPVPAEPATASPAPPPGPGTPAEILGRSTVPVLCYHQVREFTAGDSPAAQAMIIPPAVLESQLRALDDAGMRAVTGSELVDHLEFGTPLPPRPVMISFDDGSEGQFTNALLILRRLGMPATFFLMTVVLDKPRWLSTDQVRELHGAGMTIGAHTWDHQPVTRYDEEDWATQLEAPRAELSGIVGDEVDLLAYPYGAWDEAALPRVAQAGYRAAFQLSDQPQDPVHPLLTIRRVLTLPTWDTPTLFQQMGVEG